MVQPPSNNAKAAGLSSFRASTTHHQTGHHRHPWVVPANLDAGAHALRAGAIDVTDRSIRGQSMSGFTWRHTWSLRSTMASGEGGDACVRHQSPMRRLHDEDGHDRIGG